jgi:hypothetical protein
MSDSTSGKRPAELFRIHIRPGGGLGDAAISFDYCLREKVLGVGWQVEFPSGNDRTWENYESLAVQEFGTSELSRVRFLHHNLQPRDLIWTRDPRGKYYLAKVLTSWEYYEAPGSADADVVNVVHCRILPVDQVDDVPGEIVNCFRPSRAIQGIRKVNAVSYSQLLWNRLSSSNDYQAVNGKLADLFSFLDTDAVEDIVFIYLQTQGWLVIPHSRKADTMSFEFILIHSDSKKRAVVQVKTGWTSLNREDWENFREEVFLFQTNGSYSGRETPGVHCLDPEQIRTFILENLDIIPKAVQRWAGYLVSGS